MGRDAQCIVLGSATTIRNINVGDDRKSETTTGTNINNNAQSIYTDTDVKNNLQSDVNIIDINFNVNINRQTADNLDTDIILR